MAYFNFGYPWDTFLFKPWDRFNDFFHHYFATQGLNPYSPRTGEFGDYFPAAYVLFWPFTLLGDSLVALCCICLFLLILLFGM
jgi:hypothetical protein